MTIVCHIPRLSALLLSCCLGTSAMLPAQAQPSREVNSARPIRHAEDRITVDHARPVSKASKIQQVGFLEDVGHRCGPVCDCDSSHGDYELYPGEILSRHEPVCGGEVSCGLESCRTCGVEPLCGTDVPWPAGPQLIQGPNWTGEPACGAEQGLPCDCGACQNACEIDRFPLFLPVLRVNWCRFDIFAGVHGYTGPLNIAAVDDDNDPLRSGSGSFGFYQGFNEGRSLGHWLGLDLAAQFGLRATQSNLSGSTFSDETRHQIFLTGGFFRRVDYGLQYGVVVDYLNEDWYYQADLTQLRGELSWRTRRCDEFGFQFMTSLGGEESPLEMRAADGDLVTSSAFLESINQYRFFYRWRIRNEGSWSVFGGWSEEEQGVLGTRIDLPLLDRVALQTGFTYLIPDDELEAEEYRSEAWNVSLGLVFRPGGPRRGQQRYSSPLLPVADNGTFVLKRR